MTDSNPKTSILSFILLIIVVYTVQAQKEDTVYLTNGDRITGELKKYENGLLVLKTDALSTINIENDKIQTFCSKKFFEIVKKS